jgi:cell wall-associated NlpC family hydrolase
MLVRLSLIILIILMLPYPAGAQEVVKSANGRPALVSTSELRDFDKLSGARRKLIEFAIATAKDSPWLPYKFGGASPADGGFDCSGAIHFVLRNVGLKAPRMSADQHAWVKNAGLLHEIPEDAKTTDHPSFSALKPGDLLFWTGTYTPKDARKTPITHVAIYLGREKSDGRQIMINATDGRSYRGVKANGYGVYDFRIPAATAKSKLVGYGPAPGLDD